MNATRESWMSASRQSVFSPGSVMQGTSPAGTTLTDWSKRASVDGGTNPFKNSEQRATRRMISLEPSERKGLSS